MPVWLLVALPVAVIGYFLYKQSTTTATPSSGAAAAAPPSPTSTSAFGPGTLQMGAPGQFFDLNQLLAGAGGGAGQTSLTLDATQPAVTVPVYAGTFTIYLPAGGAWASTPISFDIQTVSTAMPVIGSNPAQIVLTGAPGTVDVYWIDGGGNPNSTTITFQ